MSKKMLIVFLVFSLFIVTAPMSAPAANQPGNNALLENTLILMQTDLESMDHTGDMEIVTSSTGQLISDLLLVMKDGDSAKLPAIITNYTAEINQIREQDLVPECSNALVSGIFFSSLSLLQTLAGGGAPACIIMNATNSIADILSDMQSYQLCSLEYEGDPDPELQEVICQQIRALETYDFITNWLDVQMCTPEPSASSYLGLLFNLIGIFTPCP
jgi:hypothetical protein